MTPSAFVTDTHPLLNYFGNNARKLSKKARAAFDAAVAGEATIYVPVHVMIETSQLVRKRKLQLSKPVPEWFRDLFACKSFVSVPLDASVAEEYDGMDFTADPADALIVATALQLRLPLITNDSHIHAAEPCPLYWD